MRRKQERRVTFKLIESHGLPIYVVSEVLLLRDFCMQRNVEITLVIIRNRLAINNFWTDLMYLSKLMSEKK